jgi:hypothetical protein
MKIRCRIDRVTLHGMPLSPAERVHLERLLHEQLDAALRAGWTGAHSAAPSFPQQLRIDLPPQPAGTPLGHSLGQSLGAALSPAGTATDRSG